VHRRDFGLRHGDEHVRPMYVSGELFGRYAHLWNYREVSGLRVRRRMRGFERSGPRCVRGDRGLRSVHGHQRNQVHRRNARLRHGDEHVRPMYVSSELFGDNAHLRNG
jgi:hypothetical protein